MPPSTSSAAEPTCAAGPGRHQRPWIPCPRRPLSETPPGPQAETDMQASRALGHRLCRLGRYEEAVRGVPTGLRAEGGRPAALRHRRVLPRGWRRPSGAALIMSAISLAGRRARSRTGREKMAARSAGARAPPQPYRAAAGDGRRGIEQAAATRSDCGSAAGSGRRLANRWPLAPRPPRCRRVRTIGPPAERSRQQEALLSVSRCGWVWRWPRAACAACGGDRGASLLGRDGIGIATARRVAARRRCTAPRATTRRPISATTRRSRSESC